MVKKAEAFKSPEELAVLSDAELEKVSGGMRVQGDVRCPKCGYYGEPSSVLTVEAGGKVRCIHCGYEGQQFEFKV